MAILMLMGTNDILSQKHLVQSELSSSCIQSQGQFAVQSNPTAFSIVSLDKTCLNVCFQKQECNKLGLHLLGVKI
jgi:hypothetical protein